MTFRIRCPLLALAALLMIAVSCAPRAELTWPGHNPGKHFVVLFVPADTTPIDAIYPLASIDFAFGLANRVNLLGQDAKAFVGPDLPRSGSPAWEKPVPGAAGADWIVFTTVLSVTAGPGPFGAQQTAQVEMRAIDQTGKTVFRKLAIGTAAAEASPKLMADASKPPAAAAWLGATLTSSSLNEALRIRQDRFLDGPYTTPPALPAPAPVEQVVITIASIPDHADVLIDGKFRGTTPLAVTLPTTVVLVQIERQGFREWRRELIPAKDMQIEPALEAEGQSVVAPVAPVPAPAPAPAPVTP